MHSFYLCTHPHINPHPSPHPLRQELRLEAVSFGPRTPLAVTGLRCLVVPTDAEVDTVLMMLMEYKWRSKQVPRGGQERVLWCTLLLRTPALSPRHALSLPFFLRTTPTILRTQPSLPITGTLASDDEADESGDELSVGQATNNIVAFPVLVPAEAAPRPTGALIDIGAPLPVYEDRGRPADTVPAPRGGKTGENSSAPVPATQSLTGPQGGGAPSLPPHFTPVHAPLTLVDRALGANWWEAVAGPGETVKEAGPSLLQPALGPAAPPPGPAFTDLHHEIVAFAHRASPSQVRRKREERRGAGAG